MEFLPNLLFGFKVVADPLNLLFCFAGVFLGTLMGVLPGIGPTAGISMLLPMTFGLPPVSSIIMLAGIFYGVQYGGSTTSILVNIPGEASSIVTCLDGYQMAKQGRAGPALGIAAFGSLIGGTVSLIGLMFLAVPLAGIAVQFGPPEYFSLICTTMIISIYIAGGSFYKGVVIMIVGVLLGTVGMDPIVGRTRFTFGSGTLVDGIGLVPVAMGLFGVSEVLLNLEESLDRIIFKARVKNLFPNREDWRKSMGPITRGSFLGFFLGILPGGGAILSSFISYALEKRVSRHPEDFGRGAIEGVAGPETANNAAAGGSFVPLLALGIPPNVVMALLMGALMIHDVAPGPTLIDKHPEIFWGVIASMYVGNVMLLFLNLPLVGVWVKLLRVPYRILMPLILLFCVIGSYSLNNNVVEVMIMIVFGIAGYFLKKFEFEAAPMMVAFILGPMWETCFRQSLILSDGSFAIFLIKPISLGALLVSLSFVVAAGVSYYRKARTEELTR
ncbi:MAG: tripartite tricarboxylate transporter permease [Thermodesulfobacteriota bacterium]